MLYILFYLFRAIFCLSGFSFTDTDASQDSRGRQGTIFYSNLPLPITHAAIFLSIPFLSFILILDFKYIEISVINTKSILLELR